MQFLARVYVTLKPTVNDPQGIAVHGGLRNLGFESVTGVRVGKFLEVALDAGSADDAEAAVQEMCRRLLANTVIEQFRFSVEEAEDRAQPTP